METRPDHQGTPAVSTPRIDRERVSEAAASVTATFAPIVTALIEGEKILGPNRQWQAQNDAQSTFLDKYFSKRAELEKVLRELQEGSPLTIESVVSHSADEINQFLKDHGLDIQLERLSPPDLGVASVEEVLVKWAQEGTNLRIQAENKSYDAAMLKEGVSVLNVGGGHNPVVVIDTKHPDYKVKMTVPNQPPKDGFGLLSFIEKMEQSKKSADADYKGVIFPKVDLNQQVDIDWLKMLNTQGKDDLPAIITQALQQTIFKLNEKGAYAKSGVALGAMRGSIREPLPYIIDKPFVCWIEKEGVSIPLFAGYIDYADWKDPGELPE